MSIVNPAGERTLADRQNCVRDTLDNTERNLCRTEAQERLARFISRRFALRMGLAFVVADHFVDGSRR
jgi:hypothetical protein